MTDSWFVKISLQRRHAPMVGNGALSHKIDYITIFEEILNLEGHQNRTTGSKVTAILLNAWIFPIGQSGGASRWKAFYQQGLPCLVYDRNQPAAQTASAHPIRCHSTKRQNPPIQQNCHNF